MVSFPFVLSPALLINIIMSGSEEFFLPDRLSCVSCVFYKIAAGYCQYNTFFILS